MRPGRPTGHDPRADALRRGGQAHDDARRCTRARPATRTGSTCASAPTPTGELYMLAKANGKIWKVTGTQRVRELRRRAAPASATPMRARELGARSPRRSGSSPADEVDPGRGRRRTSRPAPPVRVRGAEEGPGFRLRADRRRGAARHAGRDHQPRRDHRVRLPVGHRVLLRAPLDRQHDLSAQRHLHGQQRRPAAHRGPVGRGRLGAPARDHRRRRGTTSRGRTAPARARSPSTWTARRTR